MNRSQESSANEQRNDVVSASRLLAPGSSRDVGGVERDSMIQSDHITSARTYREGTANDNSRLHAGDVHSYNWYMAPADTESNTDSPEAKLQRLRSALTYPQMGLRSAIVEDAYLDTCQWLFNTPEYQRWKDPTLYSGHGWFPLDQRKAGFGQVYGYEDLT